MRIRTALAAATTAAAVATSGVAVAAPTVNSPDGTPANQQRSLTEELSSGEGSSTEEGSSIRDMSPQEIRDWIAVVTAIVGMLSQIFTIVGKFMR